MSTFHFSFAQEAYLMDFVLLSLEKYFQKEMSTMFQSITILSAHFELYLISLFNSNGASKVSRINSITLIVSLTAGSVAIVMCQKGAQPNLFHTCCYAQFSTDIDLYNPFMVWTFDSGNAQYCQKKYFRFNIFEIIISYQ